MSSSSLVTINDQVKLEGHNNSTGTRSGTVRFVGELSGEAGVYYGIELDISNILASLSTNQPLFAFVKKSELTIIKKSNMVRASVGDIVNIPKCECHGIIRYIGETEFKPDTVWYGIQLEEPKGAHNGVVNGVKYFACDNKYGLFVKGTQIERIHKKKRDKKKKKKHHKHKQQRAKYDMVKATFFENMPETDAVFLEKRKKLKDRQIHVEYLKQLKKLQNTVVEIESDMEKLAIVLSQSTSQNH